MEETLFKFSSDKNLNSIPEEGWRWVLNHMSDHDVLSKIGKMCDQFKKYAKDHTYAPMKFTLASEEESKVISVYMKKGRISSMHAIETLPPPPSLSSCGKTIGYSMTNTSRILIRLGYEDFCEYGVVNGLWTLLFQGRRCHCCLLQNRYSASSIIGNTIIVTGLLAPFNNSIDTELLLMHNGTSSSSSWTKCKTKLPTGVNGHTLTNIEYEKVILAGGYSYTKGYSSKVFEGTLSCNSNDVQWKELPPLAHARNRHTSFKLQDFLVVLGGFSNYAQTKSCEIFNTKEHKWLIGPDLPHAIANCSALVEKTETFALIIGTRSEDLKSITKFIIFDMDNGFKEVTGLAQGLIPNGFTSLNFALRLF